MSKLGYCLHLEYGQGLRVAQPYHKFQGIALLPTASSSHPPPPPPLHPGQIRGSEQCFFVLYTCLYNVSSVKVLRQFVYLNGYVAHLRIR